jgi:hypothetical protein
VPWRQPPPAHRQPQTLTDLHREVRGTGVGGVVRLHPPPTGGRYVLVWFTRPPADQAGTFQASVYDVKLYGYR